MKIHELAALAARNAAEPEENTDLDFPYDDSDEDDTEANLTEALIQLENCWAVLDGLVEHFNAPRARMTKYLRREVARAALDSCNILLQYNMAEIHPTPTSLSTSTSLSGED